MKRLLILTVLTASTISSIGCCGSCGLGRLGGCRHRNECAPESCEPCGEQPCDACANGAGGGVIMSAPPAQMVMPGPATYSSSYLPR